MSKGLTSFRAFAFLAVFLYHCEYLRCGYLGVQAFFVLSGFLLTPILMQMKADLGRGRFFLNFYGRRALRIFPLYYAYLLAVTLLCLWVAHGEGYAGNRRVDRFLDQLAWAFTYTYNFLHASSAFQHTHLVTHFWSLAVEEQFYLVWPLAVALVPAARFRTFLLATVAAGPLLRGALWALASGGAVEGFHARADVVVLVLPSSQIDAFAMGGLMALYGRCRGGLVVGLLCVASVALGCATELLATGGLRLSSLGYAPYMSDAYKYLWAYSLLNFVFASILIAVRERRFLVRVFENRLLQYLGTISYGLYVFHFALLWLVDERLAGHPRVLRACVALAATVLVSAASYELLERGFIRAKDRFFSKRAQRMPPPP